VLPTSEDILLAREQTGFAFARGGFEAKNGSLRNQIKAIAEQSLSKSSRLFERAPRGSASTSKFWLANMLLQGVDSGRLHQFLDGGTKGSR